VLGQPPLCRAPQMDTYERGLERSTAIIVVDLLGVPQQLTPPS